MACRASPSTAGSQIPDVPALVATGYTARSPYGGVWKVLRKPYAIEDLLDALDACAAGVVA
jgi:hypothetical protein